MMVTNGSCNSLTIVFSVVQIKLFDLRLIQKGAIQSYAGHINSHTHLPLVVDPSETLLMSGKFMGSSRQHCFFSSYTAMKNIF